MMSDNWEDFNEHLDRGTVKDGESKGESEAISATKATTENEEGCNWGFSRQEATGPDGSQGVDQTNSVKFISIYEQYLKDKNSFMSQHDSSKAYVSNPQKKIKEWFENEECEFSIKMNCDEESKYICSLDIPVDDKYFTVTSETHTKKSHAIEEICMVACRLLDECELLYPWQENIKEDVDRKRRIDEANKEDDIALDSTGLKRHCDSQVSKVQRVDTYESLMAKWSELNMLKLQLKAKLVKLDLSITRTGQRPKKDNEQEVDEEVDPLDEFMSNLDTKKQLSMDEKIEKSRLKLQLAAYEREQEDVSRLIELAKPKFDLNKVCPPAKVNMKSVPNK